MTGKIDPLPDTLIETIHEKTLELLWRWGVVFEDPEAPPFLRKHGAVAGEGGRVRFPASLVEEALKNAPPSFSVASRNPERGFGVGAGYPQAYGPGAGMTMVLEPGGKRRPATFDDAEAFLKLAHTSRYCSVSAAGLLYPQGLPPKTAMYTQLCTAL
ncbi:MAG: trimethylamine methyltransferase family protein, partial [Spirochaetaceae bacterium]|nr:trimethylamine methyltransferase family protein [Spirochaetaceae bacterium]